jgi:NTE family protein
VTNNYPIDEVRKLGADIIIGVDVQDDLRDRNSLKDATKSWYKLQIFIR